MHRTLRLITLCALAAIATAASAQANATARQKIRLQAFGMLSYVRPDYGGALRNAGGTIGADANIGAFGRLEPGLEFRVLGSGGRVSNQYTYTVGPRVELDYGRFHPYATFQIGMGTIKYNNPEIINGVPYAKDNSIVMGYGGGLDYQLTPRWAVRADAIVQSWRVDPQSPKFHPMAFSLGVRYRFHFRGKHGPGF
ncbi:MAG: outer membrane beta-barrel protein [Acidobacteria bacterium]|nr:outer membrane beta-barrel protein [Acidobacteriota bacterium]